MNDALLYFYSSAAQVSFILLGFWWAILTFRFDEWMSDAQLRRLGYFVSLHFALPGVMSLSSIISQETSAFWRIGFGAGGCAGAVAALIALASIRSAKLAPVARSAAWYALVALNLAIAVIAAFAPVFKVSAKVQALHVEAVLTVVLFFVSVQLAWWLFVQARRQPTA